MSSALLSRTPSNLDEVMIRKLENFDLNNNPIAFQNLTIIQKLNKGKFPIYLASSDFNNKQYVMKIFSDIVLNSERHYKNEIRFASLNHPNVIKIVDYKNDEELVPAGSQFNRVSYILSEYAPHGDLFDFITTHRIHIDEKLARTYFRQLIDGMEYLHSMGIAHLDLKPQNLLLDANFNLKIADFDLSHITGDEKILSKGTRNYRAPEFFNSTSSKANVDLPFAADIYSAGIILFILKTGGMCPHAENCAIEDVNLFELMCKKNGKFWDMHNDIQGKQKGFFDSKFKDLFNKMVKTNPKERLTIKKIKASKWYSGPVYTPSETYARMNMIIRCSKMN